jgi:hypothetical protein
MAMAVRVNTPPGAVIDGPAVRDSTGGLVRRPVVGRQPVGDSFS